MSNVFVVEDCGILVKLDQINGERRHFGNHEAPNRIRHTNVCVAQDELDFVRRDIENLDFGKALMRHVCIGCGI